MDDGARGGSRDLDLTRELLFPDLAPAEGRAKVDAALAGAADDERWARIEALATRHDLDDALRLALRTR